MKNLDILWVEEVTFLIRILSRYVLTLVLCAFLISPSFFGLVGT